MRIVQKEVRVVDENLDLLEMAISYQSDKTFRQQAQRRLAMKRLCRRDPVTSVCVDVVQKPLLLLALLLICWVLRIRSKNVKIKVINCQTSAIRSLAQHYIDIKRAVSKDGPPSEKIVTFRVTAYRLRWRLLLSGDVEVNPGPLTQAMTDIEEIIATVDDTTFNEDDWNDVIQQCCSLCAKWRELSGYLGLRQSDIDAISSDNAKVSDCWNEALSHWIKQNYNTERFGEPSWRTLLKAIALVDNRLFKHLADDHQGTSSKAKKLKLECEREHIPPKDVKGKKGMPAVQPRLTFPMLDKQKMTSEEKEKLEQRLCEESYLIMFRFQELFSTTVVSLKERRVTATELSNHLGCLGSLKPTYKDSVHGYLRCELQKAKTVDDIMRLVSQYSSFFNYRMLENVINNLGSEQDKRNLAKYVEEFAEYAKRKVFECPCEVGKMNEEGYANLFVTLDETYENCTVISLKNFKMELKKILDIPQDIEVPLCRVEPGSIKLTLQIPHSERQHIFPLSDEQKTALVKLGVVQVSCGVYQFIKEEREAVGNSSNDEDSDEDGHSMITDTDITCAGAERYSIVAVRGKGKGGSSLADSGLGTYSRQSVVTGPTLMTKSEFSDQDILHRDIRDDLFLRLEYDTGKPCPPDDSSQLELHRTSYRGDLDEVKRLVEENKLNPLEKDDDGDTALHAAAEAGHLDVTRYFIEEQSLNPACPGWLGWTPLHAAARYNHLHVVNYLVTKQQVDPECQDEDGYTPLHRACMGGDVKVISYLVNESSKLTPLKDILYHKTKDGNTPLHLAALSGHLKVVQLFISEYNIDPNVPGLWGRLPLHDGVQGGFLDITKYLIEGQCCNPLCLSEQKTTPLHLASGKGHLHIVTYLVKEQHCNPLCYDKVNGTPLHWAAYYGQLNVVKYFVEDLKCPQNIQGPRNITPLEVASARGHTNIVQYLTSQSLENV